MDRMIRCIEGHVFDAGKHAKCPECGWTPTKSAKKEKRAEASASLGELLASVFAALTAGIDRVLGIAGIKTKPHISSAIVYAMMILFCVGAVAYPGSPLWPGNWGRSDGGKIIGGETGKSTDNTKPDNPKNAPKKADEVSPFNLGNNPQGPDSSAPIPPKPIEVGGGGATGFGAIAFSPSKQYWGESFGYRNSNSAEQRALKECMSGSEGCVVGVSFYRQCGAITSSSNGAWGPGLGLTPQLAILDSMIACERNNGKNCELQRVTCTR